jgi:uncharacterized iron-regulated membrane protein
MSYWQRWIRQPQTTGLRKAIFQIHLWTGIGVGLYVCMVSVTGSVLVWRNELAFAATRDPIIVTGSGPRLTDEQLETIAGGAYPGYPVISINRPPNPDQAVDVYLERSTDRKARLFDPYTGQDLGDSVPIGLRLIRSLLDLHDDLLGGETGRKVNGFGALLFVVLACTGIVVWWPGIRTWQQSLTVHRNVGWRRLMWNLHSMIGFWSLGFIFLFGISGAYLGDSLIFQDLADRLEPLTPANAGERTVDWVLSWLAYLHFGRIGGIGIPCSIRSGLCDWATKAVWSLFGLAPTAMFVTGAVMWWNRVVRKRRSSPLRNLRQVEPEAAEPQVPFDAVRAVIAESRGGLR